MAGYYPRTSAVAYGARQIMVLLTEEEAPQYKTALVEQMAAAASSLKGQSNELVQTVAVFKLGALSSN